MKYIVVLDGTEARRFHENTRRWEIFNTTRPVVVPKEGIARVGSLLFEFKLPGAPDGFTHWTVPIASAKEIDISETDIEELALERARVARRRNDFSIP